MTGLPVNLSRCLQSVLNATARLIFGLLRSDHVSDALISLHWLCIPQRIQFKVAVLTYKVLHSCTPSYLGPFVRVADLPSRRALRSANTSRLIQPQSNRSTVGDRAFSVAGPQVWRLEQSATRGHISAITGHLSQASEDSSVHRVIFEHTTIVTDKLLLSGRCSKFLLRPL